MEEGLPSVLLEIVCLPSGFSSNCLKSEDDILDRDEAERGVKNMEVRRKNVGRRRICERDVWF